MARRMRSNRIDGPSVCTSSADFGLSGVVMWTHYEPFQGGKPPSASRLTTVIALNFSYVF